MAARMWWLPVVPVGFFTDRGLRPRWLLMPGIVVLTALSSSVGKLAIRRPRPGAGDRVLPWGRLGAAGFPSTHSACAFAIAGWLRASRHSRWLHAVAVLIGYSRVRCRAHHSSDVLAGAVLGYGISLRVERAWKPRRGSLRPGAVEAPEPHRHPTPPRDHVSSPARHEVRRRSGAPPAQKRRRATGSHLEVG